MRGAEIHPTGKAVQSGILFLAVLCAGQANALESAPASGDAQKAQQKIQKTKPYGKLSLSLSLTLSIPEGGLKPSASPAKASDAHSGEPTSNEKALSKLNAEIAAMEAQIKARQKELETVPANTSALVQASPGQTLPIQPSPLSATPANTVPVEPVQDAATTGISGVRSENPKPGIVAPAISPDKPKKITPVDFPGMGWTIALALLLLVVSGFVWYRRRKVATMGAAVQTGKPANNLATTVTFKQPKPLEHLDMTVVLPPKAEPAMSMSPEAEPPQKQPSILPPEYEMLEEADIYLRFGHDKLAEEALREAIRINPKNPQAYLTLLRIYFSREDSAAFNTLAQQLKQLGDGSVWPRVSEMGRSLDADNPLYRSKETS